VNNNEVQAVVEAKQAWVRPELQRIEAGSAESQRGGSNDGGGGAQGS
jgi:predicted metal-dependent hydrolase